MQRIVWAGLASAVLVAAVLVVLFAVPFPQSHTANITLPDPAELSASICGEAIQTQYFPSWVAGGGSVRWAAGGPVELWVNESRSTNASETTIYQGQGTGGSGSISIANGYAYRFDARSCNSEPVYVNVTVSVTYGAPIL